MNYANPEDIAYRIYISKQYWYHGLPEIHLVGYPGKFGKLIFDFGDEKVKYNILIPITGKAKILDNAYLAIYNFEKLLHERHPQLFND